MIDHRRLQRTLFRMQMDPAYARAMRDDATLRASSRLGAAEFALLDALDPRAVAADRDDKRRWQLWSNATSEFALTRALLEEEGFAALETFLASDEFHAAIARDGRLPFAFAAFAARVAAERAAELLAALATLEVAMAHARRSAGTQPRLAPGELALAPRARLVELADGTFAAAAALRAALDAGRPLERGAPPGPGSETVLVLSLPTPSRHALDDVHAERLEPGVAAFLELARRPLDAAARGRFADAQGAAAADLERFAAELETEGWLVRGPLPR